MMVISAFGMKEHTVVFQKILGKDHEARLRLITRLFLLPLLVVVASVATTVNSDYQCNSVI